MEMLRYDMASARAFDIGRDHGIAATSQWLGDLSKAKAVGDEPEPDLSGEWADSPTPASILADALRFAGIVTFSEFDMDLGWIQDEVCDSYEAGFYEGRERLLNSDTWKGLLASR